MFRKYIISICLMFNYLFAINVTFLPSIISTRMFLAVPGTFLMLIYYKGLSRRNIYYRKSMNSYCKSVCIFYLIVIFSGIINGGFDGIYSLYPITIALITTASFCLVYTLNKIWKGIDLQRFLWLFVLTCLVHQLISVLMFFSPSLEEAIFSNIQQLALEERANHSSSLYRFHTIGIVYFGAGVLYSYCILFITILSQKGNTYIKYWHVILIILILFSIGSAISRTTIIGLSISFLYIFIYTLSLKTTIAVKKTLKYSFKGCILILLVFCFFKKYMEENISLEPVIEYAFEGIINLANEGKFTTTSTDNMLTLYKWPDNLSTWIIGDARLKGVDEYSYYMYTDIGWCRLIFGFGIIGTIAFIYMQYKLLRVSFERKFDYVFVFILFISFLFKGISELTVFLMPAAMTWMFREQK